MIDNLSIAAHVFTRHKLMSLLVDETQLQKYVNLSSNFREQDISTLNIYIFHYIISE